MIRSDESPRITLLDGGMGRELLRMGAPFRQPQWSALSLMEAPELVARAHESFARAGSDILTTSNYAVIPFHIGTERFWTDGPVLTARSGRLARETALSFGCCVAGSIPPLFGSYRPDLFIPEQAPAMLEIIVDALSPHSDIWLAETVSSIREAEAVARALSGDNRPLWISYTIMDDVTSHGRKPRLRSGEEVNKAVNAAINFGAAAVLFNCSQPEVMSSAVSTTADTLKKRGVDIPIGVYANAFPAQQKNARANSDLLEIRQDLDPTGYMDHVSAWCRRGATIVGGCCGIGPEHIAALHKKYRTK